MLSEMCLAEAWVGVSCLLNLNNCDWQALHSGHKVDASLGGLSFLCDNWKGQWR